MTDEQTPVEGPDARPADGQVAETDDARADGPPDPAPRTGVPEVDAVLDEVESLEGRPVDEHVAVFEDAHERLRRALEGTDGLDRTAGNA